MHFPRKDTFAAKSLDSIESILFSIIRYIQEFQIPAAVEKMAD